MLATFRLFQLESSLRHRSRLTLRLSVGLFLAPSVIDRLTVSSVQGFAPPPTFAVSGDKRGAGAVSATPFTDKSSANDSDHEVSQACRHDRRSRFLVPPQNLGLIYQRTGNLRAVQILLGHSKIESTVRYLGVEVGDDRTRGEDRKLTVTRHLQNRT